ncbi:MAG: DUF4838 domain-containing protein, partial [Victivallales bacterium]|nr:DUF4838 domain-containing protein [Victivallales bacterium]
VKVVGDDLYIVGGDHAGDPMRPYSKCRTGSLFGVCELLRRVAEVRWLWPGELGTVFNKSSNFIVSDDLDFKGKPYFKVRNAFITYRNPAKISKRYYLWCRRVGMGQTYSGNSGHAYGYLMGGDKRYKKHPEYYALVNGERRPMKHRVHGWGGQICTSNKEVIRICAENALKNKNNIVSLSPNDGSGFCECAECRALDDPKNIMTWSGKPMVALTDRIFTFVNAVADIVTKKQPNKLLGHYAYTFFKKPPRRIKRLNPNIVLFFAYGCHWYRDPKMKKQYRGYIDQWSKFGTKMISREYYALCYWHNMPNIHTRLIDKDVEYLKKHNFLGVNSEGDMNFATSGVNLYFAVKKLLDPDKSRNEILDDYYQKGFGAAWREVKEYYDIFERRLAKLGAYASGAGSSNVNKLDVEFDAKTIALAGKALERAYAKVDDPLSRKRLDFVKMGFEYVSVTSRYVRALKELNGMGMSFSRLSQIKPKNKATKKEFTALLEKAMDLHKKRWELVKSQGDLPVTHIAQITFQEKSLRWGKQLKTRYEFIGMVKTGKALELPLKWRFKIEKKGDGVEKGWEKSKFDDSAWKTIETNRMWEKQGYPDYDGRAWYRIFFNLTREQASAKRVVLHFGAVDETCWLWVNGKKAGEFMFDADKDESSWRKPLEFDITSKVKPGRNVIALRVQDLVGGGGLWKPAFILFGAEKKKLVMLGDSTTLCSRSKVGHKLTDLVQANLEAAEFNVDVVNSGVGGDTVKGALRRLKRNVFKYAPDLVTISFGLNDTGKLTPEQYGDYLEKIIKAVRKNTKAEILLITSTPFDDNRHAWRKKFASKGGLDEYMNANICAKTRALAKKYNLRICDLHELFKAEFKKDPNRIGKYILPDGVHLTDAGNLAAAGYLTPVITALLSNRKKK